MVELWKVGDEVVEEAFRGLISGPFTITKITSRKITLSNGNAWTNNGYPKRWGYGYSMTGPSLRRMDDDYASRLSAQARRDHAILLAETLRDKGDSMTDGQLAAIDAVLSLSERP